MLRPYFFPFRTPTLMVLLFGMMNIYGMCNKDDGGSEEQQYQEPELKPDARWFYAVSSDIRLENPAPDPSVINRKWVATNFEPGLATSPLTDGKRYASFSVENNAETRFFPNKVNPGGKETISFTIIGFKAEPATYSVESDLQSWVYISKSDDSKFQEDRRLFPEDMNFTVTSIEKVREEAGKPVYSMTGTFGFYYYKEPFVSGATLQRIEGAFNKIEIKFL